MPRRPYPNIQQFLYKHAFLLRHPIKYKLSLIHIRIFIDYKSIQKWRLQCWIRGRRYSSRRHTERWKTSPTSGGISFTLLPGSVTTGSASASPIPNSIHRRFSTKTTTTTPIASSAMLSLKVKFNSWMIYSLVKH